MKPAIPDEIRSSSEPAVITRWVNTQVPEFDAEANASCGDVTKVDATAQARVIEQREAVEHLGAQLAELGQERASFREQRGQKLIAGEDCREIDRRLRQIEEAEGRLQDERSARQRNLGELAREAAKVHLDFVRTRRNAFAAIVQSLGDDAQDAKAEWGIRLAILEAAKRRLEQYDEGLRVSQQRCAEIYAPQESLANA